MKRKGETDDFVDFWEGRIDPADPDGKRIRSTGWISIMRHTDGRAEARKVFNQHLAAGADGSDIAAGGRWFIRNLKEADRPYVPLAATWINRGAYEDSADREREFEASQEQAKAKREDGIVVAMQRGQTAFLREFNRKHSYTEGVGDE